jgi:mono/diheme cytochrome c family protein
MKSILRKARERGSKNLPASELATYFAYFRQLTSLKKPTDQSLFSRSTKVKAPSRRRCRVQPERVSVGVCTFERRDVRLSSLASDARPLHTGLATSMAQKAARRWSQHRPFGRSWAHRTRSSVICTDSMIGEAHMRRVCFGALAIAAFLGLSSFAAAETQVERGKYLVTLGGCSDCHTPGSFLGHPDMKRLLGGSDVGFAIPGLGVFPGRNLTPDKETGLGNWSTEQIVTAMTTGKRPDGRILAPIMPWRALSQLTPADAEAIAVYLKSIPAVNNLVPGPFGPNEKPSILVFTIVPGEVYASMPKPPPPK